MSKNSFPPTENTNKPKSKGEDLLDALARIQTESKMAEVNDGIQTFLRLAYLRRKGIIKENFWSEELDTPTTIIEILSDWLVAYHFILKDVASRIPESETLNKIDASFKDIGPESNYFIQKGDNWKVKYKNETTELRNLKKLHYLLYLLEKPGEEIEPYKMVQRASGQFGGSDSPFKKMGDEQFRKYSTMTNEQLKKEGFSPLDPKDSSILLDKSGSDIELEDIRDAGYKILSDLKKARTNGDEKLIEEHDEKWKIFFRYIAKEHGIFIRRTEKGLVFFRKSRLSKKEENARTNVQKQIQLSISDMKKKIPLLYDHLCKNEPIKTGAKCCYKPSEDPEWIIRWQ